EPDRLQALLQLRRAAVPRRPAALRGGQARDRVEARAQLHALCAAALRLAAAGRPAAAGEQDEDESDEAARRHGAEGWQGGAPERPAAARSDGGRLLHAARQQRLAGDDEPLDLRRALVELPDLRVAHELLDRVLLDEAVAAVDL